MLRAAAATALAAPLLAAAPTASATSTGADACTNSQLGGLPASICVQVWGRSTQVREAGASALLGRAYTCDGQFRVFGVLANGSGFSRTEWAKCGLGRVWVRFGVEREFRDNTRVCAVIVEPGGRERREYACVWIRR